MPNQYQSAPYGEARRLNMSTLTLLRYLELWSWRESNPRLTALFFYYQGTTIQIYNICFIYATKK